MSDSKKNLSNELDDAITASVAELGSGIVTSWVLVAHVMNIEDGGYTSSQYPILCSPSAGAPHVKFGLLRMADDFITADMYQVIEDPEDDDA